jgi:hypothetical protein
VRVVAGGALQFLVLVEPNLRRQGRGIGQFEVAGRESTVVNERDRMIVRQVGAELAALRTAMPPAKGLPVPSAGRRGRWPSWWSGRASTRRGWLTAAFTRALIGM